MTSNKPELTYRVIRSAKRRSCSMRVLPDEVVVRVPTHVDDQWISAWVKEKALWISRHQQSLQQQHHNHQVDYLAPGNIPYLGQSYRIEWRPSSQRGCLFSEGRILGHYKKGDGPTQQKQILTQWYQQQAIEHLPQVVEQWQTKMGLQVSALEIKGFRSRWGSCDSRGKIKLNWKLIMAEPPVIDYVVIHELSHLLELNHSSRFWLLVDRYCRDRKIHQKYLKERACWLIF